MIKLKMYLTKNLLSVGEGRVADCLHVAVRLERLVVGSSVVLVEMCFYVDAADGAALVGRQPLVHTLHVEQVHTRQSSEKKKLSTSCIEECDFCPSQIRIRGEAR